MDPQSIAALGSLGLGVAGMMRKQPTYGYSKGDLDAIAAHRSSQIDDFAKQLSTFRSSFANKIAGFGNNAFNRFSNDAQASYASKGFAPNGGAFQSALARQAGSIQDNENMSLANMEHGDIMAVDSARGNLSSSQLGRPVATPSMDPTSMAMGQMSSALASYAMGPRGQTPDQTPYATPSQFQAVGKPKSVFSSRPNMNLSPMRPF